MVRETHKDEEGSQLMEPWGRRAMLVILVGGIACSAGRVYLTGDVTSPEGLINDAAAVVMATVAAALFKGKE